MKREIRNVGEYLEIDADALLNQIEAVEKARILVITKSRVEFAGEEKDLFIKRFKRLALEHEKEMKDFSESQKSDFILRKMLCEAPFVVMAPAPGG